MTVISGKLWEINKQFVYLSVNRLYQEKEELILEADSSSNPSEKKRWPNIDKQSRGCQVILDVTMPIVYVMYEKINKKEKYLDPPHQWTEKTVKVQNLAIFIYQKKKIKRHYLSKKEWFTILWHLNPIVANAINNRKNTIYIILNIHICCVWVHQ